MTDDLNPASPSRPSDANPDELADALQHLRAMASFREIAGLGQSHPPVAPRSGPCPDLADWLSLATGETDAATKEALLAHASLCATCLARLRGCQRALSPEISSAETRELENFASATPQWQHRFGVELAQTPHAAEPRFNFPSFVWATLAIAALIAIVIAGGIWWRGQHAPAKLLADAYSDARTFDLRIPGAAFAPRGS